MRVACLSDIHANQPALAAALDHAREREADEFLVAGDLVGKGPHPGAVVDAVAKLDAPTVRGNVDSRVLEAEPSPGGGMPRWTASQLSTSQREYLASLPGELRLELAGLDVLLVHGSPLHEIDFVFPSITERALDRRLRGRERPDVLVCGHTHIPFHRQIGGVHVVNAGTVGLPYDGDPRPSYVMLELDGEEVEATVHRFPYDVGALAEELERAGTPGVSPAIYRTGTITGIDDPGLPSDR